LGETKIKNKDSMKFFVGQWKVESRKVSQQKVGQEKR